MKKVFTLFFLLFSVQISFGQKTILWSVTDTLNGNTSIIVGTCHTLGNSFVDSIPVIEEYLSHAELAIFEAPGDVEQIRAEINQREPSLDIEKSLKRKDFKYLSAISKDWAVDLYKLKPSEVAWKLSGDYMMYTCRGVKPTDEWNHFDLYLMHLAIQHGVEMIGLETDSMQSVLLEKGFGYPDWSSEKREIHYYLKLLRSDITDSPDCRLINEYKKFGLDYAFDKECTNDVIIDQRNDNWMEVLPEYLSNHKCFVAVGFAHLQNQCGILEQLKRLGFIVEPVMLP